MDFRQVIFGLKTTVLKFLRLIFCSSLLTNCYFELLQFLHRENFLAWIHMKFMQISCSTHEKEPKNKHTHIARRKYRIFTWTCHDSMWFLYDYHLKLILHDNTLVYFLAHFRIVQYFGFNIKRLGWQLFLSYFWSRWRGNESENETGQLLLLSNLSSHVEKKTRGPYGPHPSPEK